jgi:MFS family permease
MTESGSISLRPYRSALAFGFFNATTWMIALGTPMVLLAGQLGATSFQVGLLYSFFFLLLPVQIISTVLLPHLGYKRQMLLGWVARTVFLSVPLAIAIMAPEIVPPWMIVAFVLSAFFFSFFRAIGSCAWMPWIYSLVPEAIRGRYFATEQALTATAGLLTLLLCAALFALLPVYPAFVWQFGFAMTGALLTWACLLKMPSVPPPRKTSVGIILHETPRLCLRPGAFRQYLLYMITAGVVGTSFTPFAVYFLKVEAGLPPERILMYSACQYAGTILGGVLIRHRIDRIGAKPVFRFALLLTIVVLLFWYFYVCGIGRLDGWLPAAFFVFGFAASNWAIANLKYLPRICPDENKALPVTVYSSVVGFVSGLAPLAWGLFVRESGGQAGVRLDNYAVYFLISIAVHLALFAYTYRLTSRRRELPAIYISDILLRPFRYIGHLIVPVVVENRRPQAGAATDTEAGP